MTNQKHGAGPFEGEREPGTREDGKAKSPTANDPGTGDKAGHTGIPPLPEPDVEGVGNESGPSADKGPEPLPSDQATMAKDATGF